MGLEEKYPKSGLYRENKPEVEQYADKMMDELLDGNKCFTPKTMDEIIIAEFRIHERDLAMITPEEKQNVMNFAQYASKRLAGAALHAPLYREMITEGDVTEAMRQGATSGEYLDFLHAMFAYNRTNGRSLAPAYLQVGDRESQSTHPVAIQEEMMVVMWEDVNNFMHNLLLTKDPVKVVDEGGFVNSRAEYRDTYWSRVKKLAPLKEMNPVEYYLGVFESHYLALGTIDDEELFDDFKESMEYIASHRDPEYVRLATLLYENTQSEHPDPKILLHEFQRILKPLLERLRTKNEIGGGAA